MHTLKHWLAEAVEANMDKRAVDHGGEEGGETKVKTYDIEYQPLYLVPIYYTPNYIVRVVWHPLFDLYPINVPH